MKLKPGIKVGEYPPKLKELAIQRAVGYDLPFILERMPNNLFILSSTPEGADWWWKVIDGREFEWEEEPVSKIWDGQWGFPEKWCIKRNEENYKEIEEWYFENVKPYSPFPYNRANPYLHYPLNGCGSNRNIISGYTEISMEQFRKHVLKQYPITPKEDKFQIGDYVKYKDNNCEGEAYIVKKGEDCYEGSYLVETGDIKWAYYDREGKDSCPGTCRWFKEENLVKTVKPSDIQHRELGIDWERLKSVKTSSVKPDLPGYGSYVWEVPMDNLWSSSNFSPPLGSRGIWHQLQDEKPTYQPLTVDRLTEAIRDVFYGREKTEGVEKLPKEILIKTKKKKRRVLL